MEHIIGDYQNRVNAAAEQGNKYKELLNTYSLYRLGIFALFIVSICIGVSLDDFTIIMLSLVTLSLCFAWVINKQSQFEVLKNYFQNVKTVNENEIGSITTRTNIYHNGRWFVNDKHNYTSDLDIFGDGSLFQLINRAATFPGIAKLAKWLNAPESKNAILLRQQAVSEIGSKNNWRIDIQSHLVFSIKQQKEQIKNLLEYLKIPIELEDQKWLAYYSKVAPYLLLSVIIVAIFYTPLRYFAGLLALVNVRIVLSQTKTVKKTDLIAGKIGESLKHFVSAFKSIENEQWESAYLKTQSGRIKHTETEAISVRVEELSKLINKLNYRLNVVASFILNTFFLWDIRMVIAIENWKKNNQQSLEEAFDVIAEYEALISLASMRINYPDWCFPEIVESETYTIAAKQIAHPLIPVNQRVANDYELTDTHKIDIITGSNMAGKSTFLRTIGINIVLALSGAPVCAESMRVSVMTVLSYMRIKDSLNESTSTFKAELDRLQLLLAAVDSDAKIFFLIDEMLRGTNSVDKYLGSKAVIQQLIGKKGVGMVATHDLQIAELEKQYPDYIRNFYFDIQVKDGEMLFDYKIKHGECKTFNASLLLKQIGINVES
ncbi:DNA mismatch repair protein MutS [Mucilaginibacter sp. BT774]|uniref:MutS-related protein n=1 Tax=Mucilaginibacter sp. BT774 TaxID=3062276 RepID=UPI0026744250|nr:DNA mismatch repair protein MutS [Mucilaginibacter sp. BT774]MDO3627380.1 DNA mismatch repair protein MutS [Mucilaginibacter sp. BT774]